MAPSLQNNPRANKPRVMIDTSVLLPGIIWPRWPHELLRHVVDGDVQLVLSDFLLAEVRRKFTEKFPAYLDAFEEFLDGCDYELVADPTPEELLENADLMRDIFDIPIALAAINANVDYFISQDKHFTEKNESTVELHNRLTIMLVGTFLRQVMGWNSAKLESVRKRK